jgi:pimeloyl-ACP methyl ester carboxylesterase
MNKSIIHFAHANGFPAKTYSKLFSYLKDEFEINYLELHAHNPKFPINDGWLRLRDELREELETRYTHPIIGVGHSLGGILHFLVAVENPELYKAIVLLDAPVISRLSSFGLWFLKKTNLLDRLALPRATKYRRAFWQSKEEAFEHFRQKEKFAGFDEDALRDYVEHGTVAEKTGVKLLFAPKTESKIYLTIPDNLPSHRGKLKVPAAYIGGTNSNEGKFARLGYMQKRFPFHFYTVEGTHLFPFEKPLETAETIKKSIHKLIGV